MCLLANRIFVLSSQYIPATSGQHSSKRCYCSCLLSRSAVCTCVRNVCIFGELWRFRFASTKKNEVHNPRLQISTAQGSPVIIPCLRMHAQLLGGAGLQDYLAVCIDQPIMPANTSIYASLLQSHTHTLQGESQLHLHAERGRSLINAHPSSREKQAPQSVTWPSLLHILAAARVDTTCYIIQK